MDIEILLPFGLGLLVARLTAMIDKYPDFVTVVGLICVLTALLAKLVREKNKPLQSKIYEEFMEDMKDEGRKLKLSVMPQHSQFYYKVFVFFGKLPVIGRFFKVKPISEEKMKYFKNKYLKWRQVMAEATDFIFENPTTGFRVSVLFKGDISRSDWGRELIHNLMAFPVLLTNSQVVPTNFSEKFQQTPQLLYEFKRKYLKKEKKEKKKNWSQV